jgi:hypothetical protein
MRVLHAAIAACAAFWPATLFADSVSLQITDPRDGHKARYAANWERTPAMAERYWVCDRPLWVAPGVGSKVSRLYQGGRLVELVAGADDSGAADTADAVEKADNAVKTDKSDNAEKTGNADKTADAGATRVICKLADPADAPKKPAPAADAGGEKANGH